MQSKEFSARIWIESDIPLHQITQDSAVQTCLWSEKVHLEQKILGQAHIVNVGFLVQANTRADSISLYELRLQAQLKDPSLEFHLMKNTIFRDTSKRNDRKQIKLNEPESKSKVIMVRAAAKDATEISSRLSAAENTEVTFYPWNEYRSLSNEQ